ncbi:MAG TPA: VWA domain-containing protein [Bdellovibrionota bacterium]|nr:VWA domain-containing protein [Bdellovibrionota bacterium]
MSASVLTALVRELRGRGVRVGTQELVALASALSKGLHDSSLEQFYYVARALLIHDESKLDDYDQVFAHVFKGVAYSSQSLLDEIRDWLSDPKMRPDLTEEERKAIRELSREELLRMFEERLQEQTERHDGGNHWIGTGGTSPFGTGGFHPSGISLRQAGQAGAPGGGRSILRSADARRYRPYRQDLVLDVRQVEVALRKLRSFDRDSSRPELDLEGTIDATAKNFGELGLKFRKSKRPDTRVILMMDVGGSMDPFASLVSQLFSAARRATHWKELRTYYFHNCVYDRVYSTSGLREPMKVKDLLRQCDSRYKLVFVGDAAMAPYELLSDGSFYADDTKSGLDWLVTLRKHFPKSVWLNPAPGGGWRGTDTVGVIARVFPMYPLTIAGLEEGLA